MIINKSAAPNGAPTLLRLFFGRLEKEGIGFEHRLACISFIFISSIIENAYYLVRSGVFSNKLALLISLPPSRLPEIILGSRPPSPVLYKRFCRRSGSQSVLRMATPLPKKISSPRALYIHIPSDSAWQGGSQGL